MTQTQTRYYCRDCKTVFTEDEVDLVFEDRGEFWGFPAFEDVAVCPFCKSPDFSEAIEEKNEKEP